MTKEKYELLISEWLARGLFIYTEHKKKNALLIGIFFLDSFGILQ